MTRVLNKANLLANDADKIYDDYWLKREVLQVGALPLIPYRSNAKNTPSAKEACGAFNHLIVSWKAFTSLSSIYYWLTILVE